MTPRITQNANKVAYLVQQYPEKNAGQIIALLEMNPIDINAAVWAAVDLGYISEPDKEDGGAVRFLKAPESWDFGPNCTDLIDTIYYAMEKMNGRGDDMEENYMSNWTLGYTGQDVLIAMKRLLENKQLFKYEIEDGDSSYTFFTLYENRNKKWGSKQFKKSPLKEEK